MAVNNNNNDTNGNNNSGAKSASTLNSAVTFGSGVILGVLIAPFAKEAVKKFTPVLNSMLDQFTAKASGLAEKSADIIAEAKEKITQSHVN